MGIVAAISEWIVGENPPASRRRRGLLWKVVGWIAPCAFDSIRITLALSLTLHLLAVSGIFNETITGFLEAMTSLVARGLPPDYALAALVATIWLEYGEGKL